MLAELKIENVAVIEKAQVHFDQGFNVLTGETGAGKSILIDSIQAIMGSRVSRDLVRTGARKACIWATFEQIPEQVKRQLEKAGYEAEDSLLLYREISAEGKSSCRLNGMPVTAAVVRDICGGLVSIHGQHDSHALTNPARHLALLDAYAQNQAAHAAYYQVYRQLVAVKREADVLAMDEAQRQQRMDYLRFQVDEIENAQLDPEEEARLQARRKVVTNAQDLLEALSRAHGALSGGDEEGGAADLLGEASNSLESAAQMDESLADVSEQLSSLYYTARELTGELASRLEGYSFDPGELDEIESRLDELYRLKHKYGPTVADVIACGEKARQELESMEHSTERLEELEQQKQKLYREARKLADALTQTRVTAFDQLNKQITKELDFLNMPGVRFALSIRKGPLASAGQDVVEFLISANPGEEPKPLAKIASGGELSRIMLAIQTALAEKDDIPTIIYDEIDTGVSGLAASRIGRKLHQSSKGRQVLCITHTAQIAAMADHHLLIQKNVEGQRTYTEIHPLDETGRMEALARIISGDQVTELSLANAKEMLEKARGLDNPHH